MFLYREVVSLLRLRPTLRTQLTLLYGGLLAALGGGLLLLLVPLQGSASVQDGPHAAAITAALNAAVRNREIIGAIALPLVVLLAIVGGWLVAGRLLRPLRTITATARDISATNLSRRMALGRRDDEFAELGETLDDLFGRLEASFESQRHFVANASHELRTPLTAERALLQVALADPAASTATLRSACQEVLALGDRQERLIAALLTLASGEGGIEEWEPFDLGEIAGNVVLARREDAEERGIEVSTALSPAAATGDPRLVESLVVNLVDNAIRYNVAGGRLAISTMGAAGKATLRISNTGAVIPPGQVERLFQPFRRLSGERTRSADGYGLGLAIVQAITDAHGATLTPRAQPEGGLDIEVSFPVQARRETVAVTRKGARPTRSASTAQR
jgi:signal transduction histidine kinase